jgi:hypothetical protein
MSEITFNWSGISPSDILGKMLTKVSVAQVIHTNPSEVIVWMSSGYGLRIRSRMHDIAERIEVGVLEFSIERQPDWSIYLQTVDLSQKFRGEVSVEKLVLESEGAQIECGLVFNGSKGGRITIIPSDHPYALAIEGTELRYRFGPEYSLEQYKKVPLL